MGYEVTAVDWDERVRPYVADLPGVTFKQVDLENGTWAFEPEAFDVILVNFYLYRPILSFLPSSLVPGGYLLYETFMMPYLGFDGNRAKELRFHFESSGTCGYLSQYHGGFGIRRNAL